MAVFSIDEPLLKATTKADIISVEVVIGLYAVAIPILLWYTRKYKKYRNVACIKARRPNITFYAELLIIAMFCNRIVYCCNAIYYDAKWLRVIFGLTYPIVNHAILWLFSIKYWLLYYDIQFILFSEGNQWKSHINPNNVTYQTNWYILNKKTLGNENYLIKNFVSIAVSVPTIIIPLSTFITYTSPYDIFVDLFFMIIPLILIIIIWHKTPKYLDYFRVREECRMLVVIGLSLIIMFLVFGLISTFLYNPHDIFIVVLCIEFIYFIGIFSAGLFLTWWTLLKNKHRISVNQQPSKLYIHYRNLNRAVSPKQTINRAETIQRKLSRLQIQSVENTNNDNHNNGNGNNNNNNGDSQANESMLLLISILENEHGFQMFLSHLLTEFSVESALAIIEFTQYQLLMKQIYGDGADIDHLQSEQQSNPLNKKQILHINIDELNILKLPDVVPQSIIVYDPEQQDGVYHVKIIARRLLQKYVQSGAEFEINISYKLKKKLLNDLDDIDNLNQTKLIHLFDECIQSLLLLLNDSLARFVKTAKYERIEKELANEMGTDDDDDDKDQKILNQVTVNNNNNNNNGNSNNDYVKMETPDTMTADTPNTPQILMLPLQNNNNNNNMNVIDIDSDNGNDETIMRLPPKNELKLSNKSLSDKLINKEESNAQTHSPIIKDDQASVSLHGSSSNNNLEEPKTPAVDQHPDFGYLESTKL